MGNVMNGISSVLKNKSLHVDKFNNKINTVLQRYPVVRGALEEKWNQFLMKNPKTKEIVDSIKAKGFGATWKDWVDAHPEYKKAYNKVLSDTKGYGKDFVLETAQKLTDAKVPAKVQAILRTDPRFALDVGNAVADAVKNRGTDEIANGVSEVVNKLSDEKNREKLLNTIKAWGAGASRSGDSKPDAGAGNLEGARSGSSTPFRFPARVEQ